MPIYEDVSIEGIGKKQDADAVEQGLINLLNTRVRERLFNPEFGCDIDDALFELVDEDSADVIEAELWNCLQQEVRINILNIEVIPIPEDHAYKITIIYQIKELDKENRILSGVMGKTEER